MKVLFDLITPQSKIGGAGEYVRKVFYTLLNEISVRSIDCQLMVAVDSSLGKYAYPDLSPNSILCNVEQIIDLNNKSLLQVVEENKIDKVFIGAAQYWGGRYDLEKLKCQVICVIHDLCDEEYKSSNLIEYLKLLNGLDKLLLYKIDVLLHKTRYNRMLSIIKLIENNPKTTVITVSNYSKNALIYYYGIKEDRILVLYSPERIVHKEEKVENKVLSDLIKTKKRFYFIVSANRINKNAERAIKVHQRYVENTGIESLIVTTGTSKTMSNYQIALPYLSDSDLELAYANCYALVFPSFFEGFGYPPIEAMKFGKPVVVSNVTSIPEICADGAIYFSPLYETDIFRAYRELDKYYDTYSAKALQRHEAMSVMQNRDLIRLIDLLF